jgi:hypothetical protein
MVGGLEGRKTEDHRHLCTLAGRSHNVRDITHQVPITSLSRLCISTRAAWKHPEGSSHCTFRANHVLAAMTEQAHARNACCLNQVQMIYDGTTIDIAYLFGIRGFAKALNC